MVILHIESISLVVLYASCVFASRPMTSYSDLEAMGLGCPEQNRCEGYRNNMNYTDRGCECDHLCTAYNDCCVDARRKQSNRPAPRRQTNMKCLHVGEGRHTGVYAIAKCKSGWTGPREVREKCIGHVGFSDPLTAAPVIDVAQSLTYRNLFCAECNNANMATLNSFYFKLSCEGLSELTEAQIFGDLTYNRRLDSWGVYRINKFGNGTEFDSCDILFDVPNYLNHTVRFCRSNVISKCAQFWNRPAIATACAEYMAMVYSRNITYRNPHCAICNHKTVDEMSCVAEVSSRKRPMSFALLLDVNRSDGDEVGMKRIATPECPSTHKYDPFFKKCRQLVCALPGFVIVDGRCVKG